MNLSENRRLNKNGRDSLIYVFMYDVNVVISLFYICIFYLNSLSLSLYYSLTNIKDVSQLQFQPIDWLSKEMTNEYIAGEIN